MPELGPALGGKRVRECQLLLAERREGLAATILYCTGQYGLM